MEITKDLSDTQQENDSCVSETADNAARGVSDISGVKERDLTFPEGEGNGLCFDAGDTEDDSPAFDGEHCDQNMLEKEFEELIKGRYREIYRKRTEAIVRKRLKRNKSPETHAQPAVPFAPVSEPMERFEENTSVSDDKHPSKALFESAKQSNRSRPTENGCGGSSGVVSRINVSALNGKDIRSIIRRVSDGEKITFK